ncbi:MAG: response regulator [Pseudomonadota bacterium]
MQPRPIKIAVIDDNEDEILISRHRFRMSGIEVPLDHHLSLAQLERSVADGRVECPDIVIVDMHLPGTRGTDVLRHLRGATSFKGVRRGICTGSNDPADRADALAAGAEFYLTKPLDRAALELLCTQLGSVALVTEGAETRLRGVPA